MNEQAVIADELEVDDLDAAESVVAYLRGMEDGDLLRFAEELEALVETPAWQHLGELVRMHQRRIKAGATQTTWNLMLMGKAIPDQSPVYVAAGRVRGMDEITTIVGQVLTMAEATKRQIDKATGE